MEIKNNMIDYKDYLARKRMTVVKVLEKYNVQTLQQAKNCFTNMGLTLPDEGTLSSALQEFEKMKSPPVEVKEESLTLVTEEKIENLTPEVEEKKELDGVFNVSSGVFLKEQDSKKKTKK